MFKELAVFFKEKNEKKNISFLRIASDQIDQRYGTRKLIVIILGPHRGRRNFS